jgi:hypothetical protein
MAKKPKSPQFVACKIVITSHPKAPWRVSFPVEENGVTRRKRRMFSTEEKARVADECGNSVGVIKRHYRELVTTAAAKGFFAIRPEKRGKSKITNIESGRASA